MQKFRLLITRILSERLQWCSEGELFVGAGVHTVQALLGHFIFGFIQRLNASEIKFSVELTDGKDSTLKYQSGGSGMDAI